MAFFARLPSGVLLVGDELIEATIIYRCEYGDALARAGFQRTDNGCYIFDAHLSFPVCVIYAFIAFALQYYGDFNFSAFSLFTVIVFALISRWYENYTRARALATARNEMYKLDGHRIGNYTVQFMPDCPAFLRFDDDRPNCMWVVFAPIEYARSLY